MGGWKDGLKNYERAGADAPTRHSQVKGYTSSSSTMTTFASRISCAAVIFTTSVSSNMDYSVFLQALGPLCPR